MRLKKQQYILLQKQFYGEIKRQESEVTQIEWFSPKEAINVITYSNAKELLTKILTDEKYI